MIGIRRRAGWRRPLSSTGSSTKTASRVRSAMLAASRGGTKSAPFIATRASGRCASECGRVMAQFHGFGTRLGCSVTDCGEAAGCKARLDVATAACEGLDAPPLGAQAGLGSADRGGVGNRHRCGATGCAVAAGCMARLAVAAAACEGLYTPRWLHRLPGPFGRGKNFVGQADLFGAGRGSEAIGCADEARGPLPGPVRAL